MFLGVGIESPLVEKEVWTCQTIITTQKGHNFLFNHWITLNFFQEFLELLFHRVAMESLLDKEEVCTRQTRITSKKEHNF
jgi:hypothetical protein